MPERFKQWAPCIIAGLLFLIICVFFIWIHPLVIFDQDDWHYIANYRRSFPVWEGWNPGRVMPEILMPLAGYIAAYFVVPVLGDYVMAVTVTSAILISAAILGYYLVFKKFLRDIFDLDRMTSILIGIFFILAHFALFRSKDANNVYLFYLLNLTCYFFYLLSALLNAGIVLYFIAVKDFPKRFQRYNNLEKGIVVLLLYLAIFSNLFDSAILAMFCFTKIGKALYTKSGQYKIYLNHWNHLDRVSDF